MYTANAEVKNAANAIKADAQNAVERVKDVAHKAGRDARAMLGTANEEMHKYADSLTTEIRDNPVRSSAIALGVGFVIGFLFRR